jgi:polysaccharide biosynthesis/export protein
MIGAMVNRKYGVGAIRMMDCGMVALLFAVPFFGGLRVQAQVGAAGQSAPAQSAPAAQVPNVAGPMQTGQGQRGADATNQQNSTTAEKEQRSNSDQDTQATSLALPPEAPTDFQLMVERSSGRLVPLFGRELFKNIPSTFAPVSEVPVTQDYVIGPGDEILLQTWGQVNTNARYTVNRTGEITIPEVGAIHVAGLPYAMLREYVKSELARVYRNFDLSVGLGQLRSIQVFVVGNVRRPGSFTVSSLSTLVNALFASAGPSANGSLRRIQLRRNSELVKEFDMYDLLLHGDKSGDARLLPGDVIFVPVAGPQVAVVGSVGTPAIYELKAEATIGQLLALSGGLSTTASGQTARIERIDDHHARSVADVMLNGIGEATPVRSGDIVSVSPISEHFENAVTLRGNVANPGRYAWHAGMRVHDLIPSKDALVTRGYWQAHNSLGLLTTGDYQVQATPTEGRLQIETNANTAGTGGAKSTAATTAVGTGSSTFAAQTDVVLSAADVDWNYAVIERLSKVDLTTSLMPFNLGRVVLDGDAGADLELQQGDIVTIFSKADISVPQFQRTRIVHLEGEFPGAGPYTVLPGETLRQLVVRAGGLSADAYLYGSQFTRESTRRQQQERLNEYIDQLVAQMNSTNVNAAAHAINGEDAAVAAASQSAAQASIERLRTLRATGRIVMDLKPDSAGAETLPDIALEDGDRFIVPRIPASVTVAGSVYNQNDFLFRDRQRAGLYLKMAGGANRDADHEREFIIRADGSVVSRQYASGLRGSQFEATTINPGDAIIVPQKLVRQAPLRNLLDIAQIVSQFGLGAAAIEVLK